MSRLRHNPLLSWQNDFVGKPGAAHYYFAPMIKEGAAEKFAAGLKHVDRLAEYRGLLPLKLSFMLAPNNARNDAFFKRVADEGKKQKSLVLVDFIHPPVAFSPGRPGDPTRETSHTFFNSLHRLAELLVDGFDYTIDSAAWRDDPFARIYAKNFDGNISEFSFVDPELHQMYLEAARAVVDCVQPMVANSQGKLTSDTAQICLFSSGVDTAAGRLHALNDDSQVIADMFAKFCVAKDNWIVDPEALLCAELLPADLVDHIKKVRSRWSKYLALVTVNMYVTLTTFLHEYYDTYGVWYDERGQSSPFGQRPPKDSGEKELIVPYIERKFATMTRDIPLVPRFPRREKTSYELSSPINSLRSRELETKPDPDDFFVRRQYLEFLPGAKPTYADKVYQLLRTAPALELSTDGMPARNTQLYSVKGIFNKKIGAQMPGLWAEYVSPDEGAAFTEEQLKAKQSTLRPSPFGKELKSRDLRGKDLSWMDLRGAKLGKANLMGADLTGADLTGADLSSAKLKGANFTDAKITDITGMDPEAHIHAIGLDPAKRNPRRARTSGARARRNPELRPSPYGKNLAGMDLSGQDLSLMDLSGADFRGADLTDARLSASDLTGADLSDQYLETTSLSQAILRGAVLKSANLEGMELRYTDLSGADLQDANFANAMLEGSNLSNVKAADAQFLNANLASANLAGADLSRSLLRHAVLSRANLSNATLRKAFAEGANFNLANLDNADLQGAKLVDADLTNMRVANANFKNANLTDANLKGTDVSKANMEGVAIPEFPREGPLKEHYEFELHKSPAFKKWFGKSVLVDKYSLQPVVVYHGTRTGGFTIFDPAKRDPHHNAFYFTDALSTAETYTNGKKPQKRPDPAVETNKSVGIYRLYIKLVNPMVIECRGKSWNNLYDSRAPGLDKTHELAKWAEANGYDGVIFKNIIDDGGHGPFRIPVPATVYAVFDPKAIKSATANNGNFDPNDPDIRHNPPRASRARRGSRGRT